MIDTATPFLARAHKIAIAIAAASLVFGLVWAVFEDDVDYVESNGATGYSRSALGFQAFSELLDARGISTVRSRFRTGDRLHAEDVVVIAAPDDSDGDDHQDEIRDQLLQGDHRVLVVLPKWRRAGKPATGFERGLKRVKRIDAAAVSKVLKRIDSDADLVTPDAPEFPVNGFGAEPEIDRPQLVRDSSLLPLIGGDDGLLAGERRQSAGRLVLLSDPDVVANCGIGRGGNAALALGLIESLRGEGGRVIFDETLHGLERLPSVWGELIREPLKLGSSHVALLFAAAVVAGAFRFGRPRPARGGWREGKEALLENIAGLMERVGQVRVAVGRYFDTTVERLAEYHRAPRTLERSARLEWVASRLGDARGKTLRELAAAAHAGTPPRSSRRSERVAMLELAARIHQFREEVVHGAR